MSKYVLVTGASSGIGYEMANMLLELYDSNATVGSIDFATCSLKLGEPQYPHL